MKCSELQSKLSLYVDDHLGTDERTWVDDHLAICPLCRQEIDDIKAIKLGLAGFGRPDVPLAVINRSKLQVRGEIRLGRHSSVSNATGEWIRMKLIPLGVGIVASLVIGGSFLTMMFTAARDAGGVIARESSSETRFLLAANRDPFSDDDSTMIRPADYARTRVSVAGESPSINPEGALVALTRSLMRGKMKDEEVVVVADVLSNGMARITEVVEPSTSDRAVNELERALDSDPSNAAFLPAVMDNRSDSVRIVLKFQTVDVSTKTPRKKR